MAAPRTVAPLGPVVLEGRIVRLEPLRDHHADALAEAGRAPEIWAWLSMVVDSLPAATAFIRAALDEEAQGRAYAFAVVRRSDGRVVGTTRYMEVRAEHRGMEIGWTWYSPEVWGTAVNPECKFLLLRHAFDTWGAIRVELRTDLLNVHSQAAIRKLGATFEGTLRQHRVRRDGTLRDTVVFSIVDREWPEVRDALFARVRAMTGSPPRDGPVASPEPPPRR